MKPFTFKLKENASITNFLKQYPIILQFEFFPFFGNSLKNARQVKKLKLNLIFVLVCSFYLFIFSDFNRNWPQSEM